MNADILGTWMIQNVAGEDVLEHIRDEIGSMVPEDRCMETKLVFEEAFVNVILYAYKDEPDRKKRKAWVIFSRLNEMEYQIDLYDNGQEFDTTKYEFEEREIGGHGIQIMRSLSRDMAYKREGDINHLIIVL